MDDLLARAREKLAQLGYKWTDQRRDIIAYLAEDLNQHLSAEELHAILKERGEQIGLATVYRTLELMVEAGIVHKLQFGDGRSRYEVADADHHHHHLICNRCGQVFEVPMDWLEELEQSIEKDYDFEITGHHLKIYGICSACKKAAGGEKGDEKPL